MKEQNPTPKTNSGSKFKNTMHSLAMIAALFIFLNALRGQGGIHNAQATRQTTSSRNSTNTTAIDNSTVESAAPEDTASFDNALTIIRELQAGVKGLLM